MKLTSKFEKLKKVEYSSESESSESEDDGGYLARRFFTHRPTPGVFNDVPLDDEDTNSTQND